MVPFDKRSPFVTSGIRVGTPAITTRGMGHVEIQKIVHWIDEAISNLNNEDVLKRIKSNVNNLCLNFPIYSH